MAFSKRTFQKIARKVEIDATLRGFHDPWVIAAVVDLKITRHKQRTSQRAQIDRHYQAHLKALHNYPGASKECDGGCQW